MNKHSRYNASDKGKARTHRYERSAKGIASRITRLNNRRERMIDGSRAEREV